LQLTIARALQLAMAKLNEGKFNEAENIYRAILKSQPNHPDANHNLGVIAVSLNQIEAAVPLFKTALDANPDFEQFWLSYVDALVKADRPNDARQAIKKAKKRGVNSKKLIKLMSNSKRGSESDADAHFNVGNTLFRLGRLTDAEASYKQAIALKPDFAPAHNNLGVILRMLGRLSDAEASCKQAIALNPNYADAHNTLGVTLEELGRLADAEASFNQAIALKPDLAEAHNNLGLTLQGLGKLTDAEASFNQAIALKPDFAEAYRQVTEFKKFDSQDERFSKMLELYRNDGLSDEQRYHINFGLAKVHEDLEDFERAFTHYTEGNQLRKKLLGYDVSEDVELFRQIKATYPRLKQASFQPEKLSIEPTPIFIVGMPRSGTTLVEQIVSSHPLVTGAGELPYVKLLGSAIATGFSASSHEDLLNFRNGYLDKLQGYSSTSPWVTDKMPHNFRYLGLLAKVFPEAKFIHVKRRPEAVCWGNFRTCFSSTHRYAWALDDIVTYYKLYKGLMEFWENELDLAVYSLDYDLLTDHQERETRKLIDFIGLDWEKSCLHPEGNTKSVTTASSLQVRQKVYRGSSEQWKKYEPFLNGAFESLSV
jgi:tetratricopeptide (TPR) repeat protein